MHLLITGSLLTPSTLSSYRALVNALIYINDRGIIDFVDEYDPSEHAIQSFLHNRNIPSESVHIIRLKRGEFIVPGFVDTHTHAPQVPNIGSGQQHELLDWLANVTFPMEIRFKDVAFARNAYRKVVRRFIDAGTTTCCYYGTLHLESTKVLAELVHEYGQRAFVGKCNMDRNSADDYTESSAEASVKDTEALISYIRSLSPSADGSALVHPILTPRFAISSSEELLTSLGSRAASDPALAIQTHISENKNEVVFTNNLFSFISLPNVTYASVYDHYGLLRNNTILAHAVHLEESELELIKKRKSGISHCPTSNFNLTSGMAKVGLMLDKGIKVGLGTDVSGGFSSSMLTAIQHASITSKAVAVTSPSEASKGSFASRPLPIPTLFYLATLGGAQVCNLEKQIGSLEVGKAFDALVVNIRNDSSVVNPGLWGVDDDEEAGLESRRCKDLHDVGNKEREELDAMLERFLFCGDDRNISRVYVQGKLVGGVQFHS